LHVTELMQALLVIAVYGDGALAVMISHEYAELRLHSVTQLQDSRIGTTLSTIYLC
jgi:hypothetical protein